MKSWGEAVSDDENEAGGGEAEEHPLAPLPEGTTLTFIQPANAAANNPATATTTTPAVPGAPTPGVSTQVLFAQQAAQKIAMNLGLAVPKPVVGVAGAPGAVPATGHFLEEIEINDYPLNARTKVRIALRKRRVSCLPCIGFFVGFVVVVFYFSYFLPFILNLT
jgi:hypothetical protein